MLRCGRRLGHTFTFMWTCTSEGPEFFSGLSNIAGTQTLDRSWKSLKDFLPAHMVLKCHQSVDIPPVAPLRDTICVHMVLAIKLAESRSELRFNWNLKRCCKQKTDEKLWRPISWRLWRKPQNGGFVWAKWLFSFFCLELRRWRPLP